MERLEPHPVAVTAANRTPRYPSRTTFLKPEEQAEFGVGTIHELVDTLNRAWATVGRRPLASGSFPTSRVMLRTVLRETRLAREDGLLG